ncbi:MAG: alcohol dehydrogenase catalytic domain-containing protein [Pseudomonadota bacterium]
MKALVYTANQEMTFREESEPTVEPGDALIEVHTVGICGSDMHAYLGHDPRRVPPLILGHEAVGTVLSGTDKGRRVALNPLITCGSCNNCLGGQQNLCARRDLIGMYRAGAFAERVSLPERNLIPVPDDMKNAHASLTEPGATGLHSIGLAERALLRPISEARVLVIGGGAVGLLTALLLKDKGVVSLEIAETNPLRRKTVADHTGITVFDPIDKPAAENGYDLVFDAVGSARTREAAVFSAKPGSAVVHIGLQDNEGSMDVRKMTLQEIIFIGCYTYTPVDLNVMLHKLHSGALGSLEWADKVPLDDGANAFRQLLNGERGAPKVILTL